MSEQSNAELIAEANAVSTNDVVANPRRYRNLIGRLAERLEGREPEWEYTTRGYDGSPNMERYRGWGSAPRDIAAYRRRKAGPWERVERESDD